MADIYGMKLPTYALIATLGVTLSLYGCDAPVVPPAAAQGLCNDVSWVNPTTRTDNTAFTTQTGTTIMWGAKGGPYNVGTATVAAPGTTYRDCTMTVGTRCYVAQANDAPPPLGSGQPSAPSNEACKTIVAAPSAPTSLTVR
jgi:hypothetical protein